MKAPFPWFGGKSRAANLIWQRFGNPPNYVEPFAGSLAVLLARQDAPGTETVNDIDAYLANFWRAVQADPDAVAAAANWPVNEADLHARHRWLSDRAEFRERMKREPEFYDAKIAGWWAWGCASWIGTGWCRVRGDGPPSQLPHLGTAGMGLHRQLPHLGDAGRGLHRKLPHLGDAGRGLHRKLPHLGDAGRGLVIREWFGLLSGRLARVRVACGDWQRILGPSVTEKHGITAVLLDPPYSTDEHDVEYGDDGQDVADAVRVWAIENGANPMLRIALCGYDGEHEMPDSWETVEWKAQGGYGSQGDGRGRENATRERIWFSPACIQPRDRLPFEPCGSSSWEESA
jgi:DNA adenine methylase